MMRTWDTRLLRSGNRIDVKSAANNKTGHGYIVNENGWKITLGTVKHRLTIDVTKYPDYYT